MKKLQEASRIYIGELDINVKSFLYIEEIELIASEMLKFQKQTEREYIQNILLCKLCTDIPEDFDYEKNYNLLLENQVFLRINDSIVNISSINDYIKHEESTLNQINAFVKYFNDMLDNKNIKELISYVSDKKR